ncbi:MAG: hypothetical protein NT079_06475, partial [Candidatus Omnitrophica bacterium]|nr:hypothetical protein [Candidatus Omnitrophota bacterium]
MSRTDKDIEVNLSGMTITYYLDEVKSIDGEPVKRPTEEKPLPKEVPQPSVADSIVDVHVVKKNATSENIPGLLKALGYPENTWPAIERELKAFLQKIDFPSLKIKVQEAKKNPEELKRFVSELGTSFNQQGCLNSQNPHPLIK